MDTRPMSHPAHDANEGDALRLRAIEVLDVLELDTRETNVQQMMVFIEAFSLFIQRNALYGDLWRQNGAADSLHHMKSKMLRTEATYGAHMEGNPIPVNDILDSPLDLINFATFFIRNMRGT